MNDADAARPAQVAFACDLSALTPAERARHQQRLAELFGGLVRERRELPAGFAYRFDSEQLVALAQFIAAERRCCPFLTFRLEVAPAQGSLWLEMTAPGRVKPFLAEEFGRDSQA